MFDLAFLAIGYTTDGFSLKTSFKKLSMKTNWLIFSEVISPFPITLLTSFLNSYKYCLFSEINNNELATKAPVVSVPAKKRVIN